jgi:hypothetical protein
MTKSKYSGSDQQQMDRRFTTIACSTGLLLIYAVVLPLKWQGMMPDDMNWISIVTVPAGILGLLVWLVWIPTICTKRPILGIILGMIFVNVVLAIAVFARG